MLCLLLAFGFHHAIKALHVEIHTPEPIGTIKSIETWIHTNNPASLPRWWSNCLNSSLTARVQGGILKPCNSYFRYKDWQIRKTAQFDNRPTFPIPHSDWYELPSLLVQNDEVSQYRSNSLKVLRAHTVSISSEVSKMHGELAGHNCFKWNIFDKKTWSNFFQYKNDKSWGSKKLEQFTAQSKQNFC